MDELEKKISELVGEGIFLLDMKEDNRNNLIRLTVDGDETITLETTAAIAKRIRRSGEIDARYPEGYRLEVSSPGVEAGLAHPFQYKKHVGRRLRLVLAGQDFEETLQALLVGTDEKGIQIRGSSGTDRYIPFDDIVSAKIELTLK